MWFRLVLCELAFSQYNWENMRWICESCKLQIPTEYEIHKIIIWECSFVGVNSRSITVDLLLKL